MTFEYFMANLEARNPIQINRKTDACTWYLKMDENSKHKDMEICHNRTFWGTNKIKSQNPTPAKIFHGINKDIVDEYWTDVIYTDKKLGTKEAKEAGGSIEECFYCDEENPIWFMMFNDFDKMAKFMYQKMEIALT